MALFSDDCPFLVASGAPDPPFCPQLLLVQGARGSLFPGFYISVASPSPRMQPGFMALPTSHRIQGMRLQRLAEPGSHSHCPRARHCHCGGEAAGTGMSCANSSTLGTRGHRGGTGPAMKPSTGMREGKTPRKDGGGSGGWQPRTSAPADVVRGINRPPLSPPPLAGEDRACLAPPRARHRDPRARFGREGETAAPSQAGEPGTGPTGRTGASASLGAGTGPRLRAEGGSSPVCGSRGCADPFHAIRRGKKQSSSVSGSGPMKPMMHSRFLGS